MPLLILSLAGTVGIVVNTFTAADPAVNVWLLGLIALPAVARPMSNASPKKYAPPLEDMRAVALREGWHEKEVR